MLCFTENAEVQHSVNFAFSHVTAGLTYCFETVVSWQEGHLGCKNQCHLYVKYLYWKRQRKKAEGYRQTHVCLKTTVKMRKRRRLLAYWLFLLDP